MRPVRPRVAVAAVAMGGAIGAVLRYLLTSSFHDGSGFPWTTFAINVSGSFVLAMLPAVAAVRRSPTWTAALGPGVLGGYTTLSAFSEQTRALLDAGQHGTAAAYLLGTLGACLVAVLVADRASSVLQRAELAAEGGDE